MICTGIVFQLDRKSSATLSVTARKRVSIESLLPSYGEKQNKGKTKSKEEDGMFHLITWYHALSL
jgi:ribosomal protein S19E (S16A)